MISNSEHIDEVSLRNNLWVSVRSLAACSRELLQMETIKKENKLLKEEVTELHDYANSLQEKIYNIERKYLLQQSEQQRAYQHIEEVNNELISSKKLCDIAVKKAIEFDKLKDKFYCLKSVCDNYRDKRNQMTIQFKECIKIIKQKNDELQKLKDVQNRLLQDKSDTSKKYLNNNTKSNFERTNNAQSKGNIAQRNIKNEISNTNIILPKGKSSHISSVMITPENVPSLPSPKVLEILRTIRDIEHEIEPPIECLSDVKPKIRLNVFSSIADEGD